jgi:hippurate hydrolase
MHNWPGLPVEHFMTGPGGRLAGGAFFDIHITGKGAHGARPHEAIDPVMVACHLATALQTVVARNVSAMDTAVLSVTRVQTGDAYNVIPQTATLSGTVRAFRREVMTMIEQNMGRLATAIASGFGADASLDFRLLFAPTVNDADQYIAYADAAAELVGEARVDRNAAPLMGSEDFSFMMEKVPGAHVFLGNGDSAVCHNDRYDFNDEAIPFGVALYAAIVEKKMPKAKGG